jgi:hypothetical protein
LRDSSPNPIRSPESVFYLTKLPAAVSPFSLDVSEAPLEANPPPYMAQRASASMPSLGLGGPALPSDDDWFADRTADSIIGKPVLSIPSGTPLVTVQTQYSGTVQVPIPESVKTAPRFIQGGEPASVDRRGTDRHLLMYCEATGVSWELWNVWYDAAANQWHAGSASRFDLGAGQASMAESQTSADASGLSMIPGMLFYAEVMSADEIGHALRSAMQHTAPSHVYPAVHDDGSDTAALPMGARLRLRNTPEVNAKIAAQIPEGQKILRGLQKYGVIVTDTTTSEAPGEGEIGTDAAYHPDWPRSLVGVGNAFTLADFDLIRLGWNG